MMQSRNRRFHGLANLLRVLEAEGFSGFIIGEKLTVAAPVHHAFQSPFSIFLGHIVLKLFQEADSTGGVAGAFIENELDPRRERQISHEMIAEELFAHMDI